MRAALIALMLMFGSQAWAECGNLCDIGWWGTATEADVQSEFDAGADVMARTEDGWTPLHYAAKCYFVCKSGAIQALLDAGAAAKVKNKEGKTPWDLAQENEYLKGSKGYWALNDAQYN